jgi:hypothetical protein
VTRRNLSNKEIEEIDFKDLIASSSDEDEEEVDTGGQANKQKSRMDAQELRKLLLSGNDELPEGWGGTKDDKTEGMEITFTPGLSEHQTDGTSGLNGKSKKGAEEEYETTLERYQRKQKQKKKAKKQAREEARREQEEESKVQKSKKKEKKVVEVDDAFFEADSDEGSVPSEQEKEDSKRGRKHNGSKNKKERDEEKVATDAELALLLADPSRAGKVKHFDMTEIVRAEKRAGKSDKYKKKRKRKAEEREEAGGEGGENDGFELNLEDPRFKSVLEDHQFAIDPAHPRYALLHQSICVT